MSESDFSRAPEEAFVGRSRLSVAFEGAFVISAAVMAVVSLFTWYQGEWKHESSVGFAPMELSTAAAVLALSLAIGLDRIGGKARTTHVLSNGLIGVALCIAMDVYLGRALGWSPLSEEGLFRLVGARTLGHAIDVPADSPPGITSLGTSVFLLAGACAGFAAVARIAEDSRWKTIGLLLVCAGGGLAGLNATAQLAGTPLLHGYGILPMRFSSTVALLFVFGALSVRLGLDYRVCQMLFGRDQAEGLTNWGRGRMDRWLALGVTWTVIFSMAAACYEFLRYRHRVQIGQIRESLEAIVGLKVERIAAWHAERLADAGVVRNTPLVRDFLDGEDRVANSAKARETLKRWMQSLRRHYGYEAVALLDRNRNPLVVDPETGANPDLGMRLWLHEVFQRRETSWSELFWDEKGIPHLELFTPVLNGAGESHSGGVLLSIDPRRGLFPLVRDMGAEIDSGELLLLQNYGGRINYLHDWRARMLPSSRGGLELTNPELLGHRVIAGRRGLIEAPDYRGVLTLGLGLPIPGTTWFLVGKVDKASFDARLREEVWIAGGSVAGVVVLLGVLANLVWRRRRAVMQQHRRLALEERERLAVRLGLIMQHARDVILILGEDLRVRDANDPAYEVYGYDRRSLAGMPIGDLCVGEQREVAERKISEAGSTTGIVFETLHQRGDGSVFPVEISARWVALDAKPHCLAVLRDVSERKEHERQLEQLSRLYLVRSQVSQAIVRTTDAGRLAEELCGIFVNAGGFHRAQIAWLEESGKYLTLQRGSAADDGGSETVRIFLEEDQPECRCVREGRTQICNDLGEVSSDPVWKRWTAVPGLRSGIVVPFRKSGVVAGALLVQSRERYVFGEREIVVFEEASMDFSFALDSFALEERRKRTESALEASEARLKFVLRSTPSVIYAMRADGDYRTTFISDNVTSLTGFLPGDFLGSPTFWIEHVHPDDLQPVSAALMAVRTGGSITREYRFRHKDGGYRWTMDDVRLVLDDEGTPTEFIGAWLDITERKNQERLVVRLNRMYRVLSQVNETLVRATSIVELAQSICRIIVDQGRFRMATIGWLDREAKKLTSIASCEDSGVASDALGALSVEPSDTSDPRIQVLEDGRLYVCNDLAAEVGRHPRMERLKSGGFGSLIVLPIHQSGSVCGILSVLADEAGQFGEDEVNLLGEAARDISFAIDVIDGAEKRKVAEAGLRRSEELYRLIADNTSDAIWLYDFGTARFAYLSPSAEKMLGYMQGELLNRSLTALLTPESCAQAEKTLAERLRKLTAGDTSARLRVNQYDHVHKSGAVLKGEVVSTILCDASGRPTQLLGVTRDITERLHAEEVLHASEQRYRFIAENTSDVIWVYDLRSNRFTYASPSVLHCHGYKPEELLEKSIADMLIPSEVPERLRDMEERIRAFAAGDKSARTRTYDLELLRKDGSTAPFEVSTNITVDSTGKPVQIVGVSRDTTARKRAEEKLRKLTRAIEQAPLSIAITDLAGSIEYVNPRFTEVTGYSLEEVRGKNPRVLKSGVTPPEVYRNMWQTLVAGQVWRGELSNRKKNGEMYFELAVIAPVVDESGKATHYVALKEDITERMRIDRALQESEARYRLIAENSSDVIWLYDLAMDQFTYVSPSVYNVRGYTPDEVIGQKMDAVLAPNSKPVVASLLAETMQAIASGEKDALHRVIEVEQSCKNGGAVPTEVSVTVLLDESGRPAQILGVTRNISDRRKSEMALRESRDRLAEAERMAHLGNWELDLVNDRLSWSDEIYRIFEIDPNKFDASYKSFVALIHPEDREAVNRAYQDSLKSRMPYSIVHRLLFPDGRIKYVQEGCETVYAEDGRPLRSIGTVLDITERKRIEEDLHDLVKGLRAWHAVSLVFEQQNLTTDELLAAAVLHIPMAMQHAKDAQASIEFDGSVHRAGAEGVPAEKISSPITVNQLLRGWLNIGYVGQSRGGMNDGFFVQERALIDGIARTIGAGLGLREAFAELSRSEERARTIFENVDVGMFEMSLEGRLARGNRRLSIMLEVQASSLDGLSVESIGVPEEHYRLRGLLARLRDRTQTTLDLELRCRTSAGAVFWGALRATVELDAEGNPSGCLCVLQDISHEVEARQTLRRFNTELEKQVKLRTDELESRNREVQALLQSIPDMVMRVRRDGKVLYCQRAHGDSALASMACKDSCDGEHCQQMGLRQPVMNIGQRALGEGGTVTAETELGDQDKPLTVELRAAPVGTVEFVVFIRDITGRKQLEAEMANMLRKEREISQMKSRFISVTSHEFRTPMSAAIGSVDMLKNHMERLTAAKRMDLIGRIQSSLQRMNGMIDDMLTLNRAESGRVRVDLSAIDLVEFARDLLEEIRAGDRDSHLLELKAGQASLRVTTDPNILRQILSNLLSNAVRYSPAGTPVILGVTGTPDSFRLTVEDQGIGIPESDRSRVLEPFERGSNVGEIRGTGLGLNIVKRMAELLGGQLEFSSVQDRGSTFTVSLPQPPRLSEAKETRSEIK